MPNKQNVALLWSVRYLPFRHFLHCCRDEHICKNLQKGNRKWY